MKDNLEKVQFFGFNNIKVCYNKQLDKGGFRYVWKEKTKSKKQSTKF